MSAMDVVSRPLGPVAEAARRLRGVQRAMTRLSSLDSVARLVAAAPREACRAIGFERAMLSHIRGDRVAFASVSFEASPIMAADFARLARAVLSGEVRDGDTVIVDRDDSLDGLVVRGADHAVA